MFGGRFWGRIDLQLAGVFRRRMTYIWGSISGRIDLQLAGVFKP